LTDCGVAIGHGLARTGLGDALLDAALILSLNDLQDFLVTWRQDLIHELSMNASGQLSRTFPSLADRVSNAFPRLDVLICFAKPITSQIVPTTCPDPSVYQLDRFLDISRLATFCQQRFGWGSGPGGILSKFTTVLWDGIAMQMLCKMVQAEELGLQAFDGQPVFDTSIFRTIHSCKMLRDAEPADPEQGLDLKLYKLVYSTSSFVLVLATTPGYNRSVWISAPIVHTVLPQIVATYAINAKPASRHSHSMASVGIASTSEVLDLTSMDELDSAAFLAIANMTPFTNPMSMVSVAQQSGRSIDDAIDLTGDDLNWTGMGMDEVIDLTGDDAEGLSVLHSMS
jgi:hypothetical protein